MLHVTSVVTVRTYIFWVIRCHYFHGQTGFVWYCARKTNGNLLFFF